MISDAQNELLRYIYPYPENSLTAHCPTCLLRLELRDGPVECECCDSILRPAPFKPSAFELVKLGTLLETPAEKEDRIKYEEEISRISFPEQKNGHADVIEIDISEASQSLRDIRRMDYLPIICGLQLAALFVSGLIEIFKMTEASADSLLIGIVLILDICVGIVLILGICVGYMHIGVIDERAWGYYLFVLPLLLLLCVLLIIIIFHRAVEGKLTEHSLIIEILMLLKIYLFGFFIAASFLSALRLRKLRLSSPKLLLIELLSELRSHRENISIPVRRLNKPLGITLTVTGSIIILASSLTASFLVSNKPEIVNAAGFVIFVTMLIGCGILLRSRRYFQIDAHSLLSVDKRPPILFLRQFSDDPKLSFRRTGLRLIQNYLDFSLETRLSNYFTHFGPFIAVGVSGEAGPMPGAARAILSHREWIQTVSGWMNEANVIVIYAGWTNWVSWELAKIIETNNVNKLILILPEVVGEVRAARAEHVSLRIERLNRVLKDTIWYNSMIKIHDIEDARALLFRKDGSVVVIRSEPYNRDSYHLAALIAHYILLNQNNLTSLLDAKAA